MLEFERKAREAIAELRTDKAREAIIIHHDDADGLCSAAVTKRALEREDIQVKTFCLEKIYTEVVEDLHSKAGQTIFYVDIGSAHANLISECNKSRNLTIILDHHDPKPSKDPKVLDLNLEHFGFKGETDFSGATCCYLFAKALNSSNVDLSYLALVGSCEIPEGFLGMNKAVLEEALKNGIVRQKGKSFEVTKFKTRIDTLFSKLQVLAAVGYYEGGPEVGIRACLEGLNEEAKEKLKGLETRRKETNRRVLGRLYRERLKETEHIQWFDAGNMYVGMGTKVIGQFCSFLSYQARLIKPDKYIMGFINVLPEIPGWGKLKENLVKASVRVPRTMKPQIEGGKLPSAVNLLDQASEGFGIADGHQYAASVIVPTDKKEMLVENAEKMIETR
jgi:single-stranded-DNA-specific exonuclease